MSSTVKQESNNLNLSIARSLQVASGNKIYEGRLVGISNGKAIVADTTHPVVGVAITSKAGGHIVTANYNHVIEMSLPGVVATDYGATAYAATDITLTVVENSAIVGQITEVNIAKETVFVHMTLGIIVGDPVVNSIFGRSGDVIAAANDYNAAKIFYDNSVSGLVAIQSQAALDEIDADLDAHLADTANPHDYPKSSVYIFEDTDPGTMVLLQPAWEDMRVVPTAFDFAGVSDPTLVNWQPGGAGTTFKLWEFATNDEAFFSVQLPHTYKEGTDLKAHIHWTPGARGVTENANTVAWKMDYTWANIDAAFPSSSNIDLTDTCSGADDQHEMTADADPTGAGKKISSMLVCRIYRDTGDTWTGTGTGNLPLLLEVDFHFLLDTIGSRQSVIK